MWKNNFYWKSKMLYGLWFSIVFILYFILCIIGIDLLLKMLGENFIVEGYLGLFVYFIYIRKFLGIFNYIYIIDRWLKDWYLWDIFFLGDFWLILDLYLLEI